MSIDDMRRLWPLGVFAFAAMAVGLVLHWLGRPWTTQEWASNFVFAYGVALVAAVTSRRESRLQEALATTALVEKTGVIFGAVDRISVDPSASRIRQALYDMRASLPLYRLAADGAKADFVDAAALAIEKVRAVTESSLRAQSMWNANDFESYRKILTALTNDLDPIALKDERARPLHSATGQLAAQLNANTVSFDTFASHFRDGDSEEIRVLINWNLLEEQCSNGDAVIRRESGSAVARGLPDAFTPWYVSPNGSEAQWYDADARPMTVREAAARYAHEDSERGRIVRRFSEGILGPAASPTPMIVATLEIGDGLVTVLDGNHRLVAWVSLLNEYSEGSLKRVAEYRVICRRRHSSITRDANILEQLRPDTHGAQRLTATEIVEALPTDA